MPMVATQMAQIIQPVDIEPEAGEGQQDRRQASFSHGAIVIVKALLAELEADRVWQWQQKRVGAPVA